MTDHMPHEGPHDHPHTHPPLPMGTDLIEAARQSQPMPEVIPISDEAAIHSGAQHWLAREFVGGLIAMAQAVNHDVADFLAEKCMILSVRLAHAEAEVELLRTRITTLDARLAECGCHEPQAPVSVPAQPGVISPYENQDVAVTNNGDGS